MDIGMGMCSDYPNLKPGFGMGGYDDGYDDYF
jgi:hypothetical protein